MSNETTRIAIPSVEPGGVQARLSAHFGRCDCFTVLDVTPDGHTESVAVLENPGHENGGCLSLVNVLSAQDVDALVVAGIGARPLAGFTQAGISVYREDSSRSVGDVVEVIRSGGLTPIDPNAVCGHSHD